MAPLLKKLRALDAYPKINDDFFKRTLSGGIITLLASSVMALLFISELRLFLRLKLRHELKVDTTRGQKIDIHFDITFPMMPCVWMSLDAMDISGELQFDVDHEIYKSRLGRNGTVVNERERHEMNPAKDEVLEECGSCYGAEANPGDCCNTCEEVRRLYVIKNWSMADLSGVKQCQSSVSPQEINDQEGEGCRMWGSLSVNRVAGNFHFAPGKSFQRGALHVHDMQPFKDKKLDFTHQINKLIFGEGYPGMSNPFRHKRIMPQLNAENKKGKPGMFQYFLKVVPTIYTTLDAHVIKTNQLSVTEHFYIPKELSDRNLPGIFFFYDLSPIKVQIHEYRESFIHFLTTVCAIIGGVFTVSGLIDSILYHGHNVLKKKIEIGKLN